MIIAKEKAKELVNNFKNGLWKDRGVRIYSEDAIYCALIAVDELIKETGAKYWYDVKREIELL